MLWTSRGVAVSPSGSSGSSRVLLGEFSSFSFSGRSLTCSNASSSFFDLPYGSSALHDAPDTSASTSIADHSIWVPYGEFLSTVRSARSLACSDAFCRSFESFLTSLLCTDTAIASASTFVVIRLSWGPLGAHNLTCRTGCLLTCCNAFDRSFARSMRLLSPYAAPDVAVSLFPVMMTHHDEEAIAAGTRRGQGRGVFTRFHVLVYRQCT